MEYHLKTIPHSQHRYPTVGDYWKDGDSWNIRVSQMENSDYEFLVALHELIELYLTQRRGISEESISEFDISYEQNRPEGDESEPGDDKSAPYYAEHQFATAMERMMAAELGVDWNEYDNTVNTL